MKSNQSRAVIAFSLLNQSAEALKTDLLSGVALLIRPLVSELANSIYDANHLSKMMGDKYGLSISPSALEGLVPRLINSEILRVEESINGLSKVFYNEISMPVEVDEKLEIEYENIIEDYINFCKPKLERALIKCDNDFIVNSFLKHLCTLDFSAIHAKPIVLNEVSTTQLIGPEKRETIILSEKLSLDAAADALMASYLAQLYKNNHAKFVMLEKISTGALGLELVLDLQAPTAVPKISNTTAIIDTPTILAYLDLSSKQDTDAAKMLFKSIISSGAKIAAFKHSIEEASGILDAIKNKRVIGEAFGPSIARLNSSSIYRAYFDSMVNRIEYAWCSKHNFEIIQETSTHFYVNFSAEDEENLTREFMLSLYDRRLTRERDAQSVAETIRRLGGAHIPIQNISNCKFIFITNNGYIQQRAASFLRRNNFVKNNEFMPIVTDRYMAGLCWLISGGITDNAPSTARLLANCSAALRLKPELAERTKKFLNQLDDEKAKYFESLMTHERASQYLTEVTLGNINAITISNVDDIYQNMLALAAEKVASDKDAYYNDLISNEKERIKAIESEKNNLLTKLRASTDSEMKISNDYKESKINQNILKEIAGNKEKELEIVNLENQKYISKIQDLTKLAEELEAIKFKAFNDAKKRADVIIVIIKITGSIFMLSIALGLNYSDKFIIPKLSTENQYAATIAFIARQVIFSLFGLSFFIESISKNKIATLHKYILENHLKSLKITHS